MRNDGQSKHDLTHLAILMGAALAVGTYLIVTNVLINPDGTFYIRRAQELARDGWDVAGDFPPGYPLLLLAARRLVGLFVQSDSILVWIYSSQAVTLLCRMLALVCLYSLGKLLTDARRSFWAVLVLVCLPYPADYGSDVLREWPFLLFLALGFWLLVWALRNGRPWVFGLIGLVAGLGSLIRPECGQLVVYGAVGLVVASVRLHEMRLSQSLAAGLLLVACFLVPASPYVWASGTVVPHQLRPSGSDRPPVITSVGGKSASDDPLEFEVSAGELLEMFIEASDPDGNSVTLSAVAVPVGTRPAYRFRGAASGDCFLTISEREKDSLLATYARDVLDYDGIAFYAFARADEPAGLRPVCRFWSPVRERHFFTISESEQRTIAEDTPAEQWQNEGVAFYAFPEGAQTSDAAPVYRFRDATGAYFWAFDEAGASGRQPRGDQAERDGIAWYVHSCAETPPGLTLEAATIRWRPGPDQQGEHLLNIIASDGRLQSCQLVRINVEAARIARAALLPVGRDAAPIRLGRVLYEIGDAFGANLMYVFLIPLGLGLYRYLKDEAGPYERALTAAVIVVNLGLIITRYVWIDPGPTRRYCLALVALAVFHIPRGAETMARRLRGFLDLICRRRISRAVPDGLWFYLLMALGIGPLCLPKLLKPMRADKRSYRAVAQWLRDNTKAEDVIAVPDVRISFYAEREGLPYGEHADPRKADYVVALVAGNSREPVPSGWREEHSLTADRRRNTRFVVYKTP